MKPVTKNHHIICGNCRFIFERDPGRKHCSNCFACTGCEVYYCPSCDNEIIITPVGQSNKSSAEGSEKTNGTV